MTTLPVVLEMVRLPAGVPAASVCVIVAAVLSSVTDSFISVVPVSVVAPVTPSVVPTVNDPDAVNVPVTVADAKVASPVVSSVPATATASRAERDDVDVGGDADLGAGEADVLDVHVPVAALDRQAAGCVLVRDLGGAR
jgi:hypothetical protein